MKRTPLKRGTKPLKADFEKTREWQQRSRKPLKTGDKPMQRTEMSRKPTKRKRDYEAELDALTPALLKRSRGMCEMAIPGVCSGKATHRHHRKVGRGKGTNAGIWCLIHCCTECHSYAHLHPQWSRELGFLVRKTDDPFEIPVTKLRRVK